MITFLYILLLISVALPIYTYALYPVVLKLLPSKSFETNDEFLPKVRVVTLCSACDGLPFEKIENLNNLEYPDGKLSFTIGILNCNDIRDYEGFEICCIDNQNEFITDMLSRTDVDVTVFTDADSELDANAISMIVRNLYDNRIGCVSGQVGRKDGKNSAFWKYENLVKKLESKIGCLSGANNAIYAVKNGVIDAVPKKVYSPAFYIATKITECGYNVLFDADSIAYEKAEKNGGNNFKKHVEDGSANYQSLGIFWRLLLPVYGSFVFVSHRVLKWLVPFNMISILVITAILSYTSAFMFLLLLAQVLGYAIVTVYYFLSKTSESVPKGKIGKILSIFLYFLSLNLSLFVGFINLFRRK